MAKKPAVQETPAKPTVVDGKIVRFNDDFFFLNNFANSRITINGITYPTVQHAFEAMKTSDKATQQEIADTEKCVDAMKIARTASFRPDFLSNRLVIMEQLLEKKFANPYYKKQLLATGDKDLVNTLYWKDNFWGVQEDTGEGQNWLGRILTKIREKYADDAWFIMES